ncbi:7-cyano-7-deazaguanine synthase [Staphylococcus pettenkoferi]|uniref:7-cyano-7-deazaguanine synthase n=1 Tax=Staphylococcus pettenkoferi TaxID=170573 RepID=UPI0011A62EDB|nr:7-cyano-7-deazaguanine synthase [Staphylococcus pettenkoferi]
MSEESLEKEKGIVVFRGGEDSRRWVLWGKKDLEDVELVSLEYGEGEEKEIEVGEGIGKEEGVKDDVVDMWLL